MRPPVITNNLTHTNPIHETENISSPQRSRRERHQIRLENPAQTSHPCRDAAAIHQRFSVQRRDIVLEVEVFGDLLHDRIVNSALDLDLIRIFVVLVGSVPAVFDAVLDGFAEDSICFRFHVFMGLGLLR